MIRLLCSTSDDTSDEDVADEPAGVAAPAAQLSNPANNSNSWGIPQGRAAPSRPASAGVAVWRLGPAATTAAAG